MSDTIKLQIACIIGNVLKLACFTVLAILFKHWWIVLVVVFFWESVKETTRN